MDKSRGERRSGHEGRRGRLVGKMGGRERERVNTCTKRETGVYVVRDGGERSERALGGKYSGAGKTKSS